MPRVDPQAWFQAALIYAQTNRGWHSISYGTEEYEAWRLYFIGLGWTPWAFRRLASDHAAQFTAPCQWPDWFDFTEERARLKKSDLKLIEADLPEPDPQP